MTVPSPPDGRPLASTLISHDAHGDVLPEPLLPTSTPPTAAHDLSGTRGRAPSAASPIDASPRGVTAPGQPRAGPGLDADRKPPASYGHHRQTSIVHGVQHSRNASLLASAATAALSPHKILAHGAPDSSGQVKSPSMTALTTEGSNGSALPANKGFDGSRSAQRRPPQRMHSGRIKPGPEHHRSQSKAQPQESKTVGEFALHHLFTAFIAEADERIERCVRDPRRAERDIERICGPGADPPFDQLISSLGHINRHKPKSLIDSVIHWRKNKANIANIILDKLSSVGQRALHERTAQATPGTSSLDIEILKDEMKMAERRSAVSVYILCRVLIEIIGQTTLAALNGPYPAANTADRLEDVIYGQVQGVDPQSLADSPIKRANWVIRCQLLGVMSTLRFEEVSDRFVKDLRQAQLQLSVKGAMDARLAAKTALLVQSMRWLNVQTRPEAAWDHTCDTMQTLGKFFAEVHGRVMKHAYTELFDHLMLPIAAKATTELYTPKWKDFLSSIQPKVTQMLSKADHWPYVYPLQAVILCVSPADSFATHWLPTITALQPKARDRAGRSHALKAICRLVWRYLYRLNESQTQQVKKLEEIIRLVFQGGKRVLISTDPEIADPLIQLIRIIGFKHQDMCFRSIIFPLMNSELFSIPEKDLKIESLDPERTVIAIRAFLAVMADLEKGEPPPFPVSFECDTLWDPSSRSPITHRRTRSQGFAVSAGKTDRLSRPVMTTNFTENVKEYYVKFCKILGQLTIICDNTFGGQAALDEKFASHTPKTPMADAFAFNRRDDVNPADSRQQYYDLLHVAVEALPRCLSPHLPINALVNLLCTGTAHVQSHIAASSAQSLKSIARQSHAQQVTVGFARFIFNFDDRYATVSDGGLLGPGHIENTLKLYVELVQIWIEDVEQRTSKASLSRESHQGDDVSVKALPLDLSSVLAHVDEIESRGLFFLCSPSRVVRSIAVNVLRLVTKFDKALGRPSTRIITILEGSSQQVIDVSDERLTLAERSRLQKGLRKSNINSTLVELCSSDITHDQTLWFKIFPNLIQLSSHICLHAVALTREIVCMRLSHSYRMISQLAEGPRQNTLPGLDSAHVPGKLSNRIHSSSPDIIVEQWKLHLIFACTTLTNVGSNSAKSSQSSQHTRKSSKSSATSEEKIASACELFQRVVPFLGVLNPTVREAAVVGLGATNANLFQTLLENLHPFVMTSTSDAKERLAAHHRSISSPVRRSRTPEILRTEITRLLSLTAHLLSEPVVSEEYIKYLVDYAKQIRIFLSDAEVQSQLDHQKLRTYFCTLTEALYDIVKNLKDSTRWFSFQSRQATFSLMENWCGYSPNETQLRRREDHIRRSILELEVDSQSKGKINAAIEKEKVELQSAALSCMAALCAGPLSIITDGKVIMQFDVRRILSWIAAIFEAPSDRIHTTGRRALQNLLINNLDQPYLMAQAVRMCYTACSPKALHSYFEVVTTVLTDNADVTMPFWKVLSVGLYTLGNEDSQIRTKSARLLRVLEERQNKSSKLQDFDIRVSDKTTAVYKLAQYSISCRLAMQHKDLAFHVFSEFSAYFNELQSDHQRNMVSAMLPWIQTVELQLDPNGGPSAPSYMLLVNLFEITAKVSVTLHNEIQALWQALATGPYAGNVQLVLDFIMALCLDRKEQNFVVYAKQIVVSLSGTAAGAKVIDYLLLQISPRHMVPGRAEPIETPADTVNLPYTVDLGKILPSGQRQNGLAQGQLSMILLVDLVVSPTALPAEKVSTLLQVVLVQWDQTAAIVQEQAREMLVHLIHELVISKIEPGKTEPDKQAIEDFIEAVRIRDAKTVWSYADRELGDGELDGQSKTVSETMAYVVEEVVRIFSVTYPGIRGEMGRVTMAWATSCAVRHIACRSFQIFRCIQTELNSQTLADMLARLSNTIADDEHHDYLIFSLEILTTLRSIIEALSPIDLLKYPQLFWVTCACLDTIFEQEFQEGLTMLGILLAKMDLSDEAVVKILKENQPSKWDGGFRGLFPLINKGIRSSKSMRRSLTIMQRLIRVSSNEIVGGEDRLLYTTLSNLPRFMHHFRDESGDPNCVDAAEVLTYAAEIQGHLNLARALQSFVKGSYHNVKDFLSQTTAAIRSTFYPEQEFDSLVFLLGMCNNECAWFKVNTMQILCVLVPEIDMRKPEIASQGPDLISPLLRLLQTEHYQQALEVLDNVIEMTGTPLDNKHIRMSMAGSHSTRATRKEYESTKSLYGIPEESGWSVPMPALHSTQTRANVHAVFYSLAHSVNGAQEARSTPDVEFHKDDYESYLADRTATMLTEDTRADGNMGELAIKLDNLDDFFDDDGDVPSPDHFDSNVRSRQPSGLIEEREYLYDQQALPILHRSLQRNSSVTSFQAGFAEMRYPNSREPSVMTPGAFAVNQSAPLPRPGMHSRSITSPVTGSKAKPGQFPPRMPSDNFISGDEATDELEPFSDDDLSINRAHTADESFHSPPTEKPSVGKGIIRAGFKQGFRRLTSTSGNRAEVARTLMVGSPGNTALRSPKVPKVPAAWLKDPVITET